MPSSFSNNRATRQTRLTFSPLPDDSPGKRNAPEAIKDRVAGVSIDGSPLKRKETVAIDSTLSSSSSLSPPPTSSPQFVLKSSRSTRSSEKRNSNSIFTSPMSQRYQTHKGDKPSTRSLSLRRHAESAEHNSEMLEPSSPPSALKFQREIFDDEESNENDEESDEDDVISPANKRRRLTSIINNDESRPMDDDSNDDDVLTLRQRRRRQKRASSFIDDEEADDENREDSNDGGQGCETEMIKPSVKRRRRNSNRQREDLVEDLEFLGESAAIDSPRASRKGKQAKPNARQQALEMLKRRRQSQQQPTVSREHESTPLVIQSSDEEDEERYSDVSQGVDQVGNLDNDLEGFIESDDEGQAPVMLPSEFSQIRSQKPRELFKFIIEWMVQKKVNPAFAMEDEVYRIAFKRLDDYARGLGGSKFTSSAWVHEFTKVVLARPNIDYIRIVNSDVFHDKCDACNRGNHPATWEVTFQGSPYNKTTLEQYDEDSEYDEDLPDEDTVFYLGRFCMNNARNSHALAHWKFNLNEWTVDWLRQEGHLTAEKLVERDSWSTAKRQKYADNIIDGMEENGEIRRLYRDFKSLVEEAQNSGLVDDGRLSP